MNAKHYQQIEKTAIQQYHQIVATQNPRKRYRYDCWFHYPQNKIDSLADLDRVRIRGTVKTNSSFWTKTVH
jgi:hypothetical protein